MDMIKETKGKEPGSRKTIYTAIICCILGVACMYWAKWLFLIYGPLFLIAFVLGIVVLVKGQVLAGLGVSLASSVLPGIMFVILFIIPNKDNIEGFVNEWSGKAGLSALVIDQHSTMDKKITTPKFELEVFSAKNYRFIGKIFRHVKPSSGAIYFAVKWQYKNISSKPIPRLGKPTMILISPDGNSYNEDIPASRTLSQHDLIKGVSANSINPGIVIKRTAVFEVGKKVAKQNGWKAIIKADELVEVKLD